MPAPDVAVSYAPSAPPPASLLTHALARLAAAAVGDALHAPTPELAFLVERARGVGAPDPASLAAYIREPARADAALVALARATDLGALDLLTVALTAAVEDDPMIGRILAHLQAPLGGSRPTMGLLAAAFADLAPGGAGALALLSTSPAVRAGLLVVHGEGPAPERTVSVPLATCLALRSHDGAWPGARIDDGADDVPLPPSIVAEARRHAAGLAAGRGRALVLRTGSAAEGRAAAAAVAAAMGLRAVLLETDKTHGLGPWLWLRGLLPVHCVDLAPGERRLLPAIPLYDGPVLALTGPDGAVATASGTALSWSIPVPPRDERRALWERAIGDVELAASLAQHHRHGSGRIAHLGRLAQHRSAIDGRARPAEADVVAASWIGEGAGLDGLAQPLPAAIADEALVVSPELRADLEALLLRCRARDALAEGLGPSATARYAPGVRALFVGPSGTGKTLAAGWLAARLGLPLYRVDLAGVTSKYIGETEKNLAQLLARAEHAEVVLLFDEADSLFGKRTDIKESNDRFANAQTNYLLQRIESFDGIALLTSNSSCRFDSAFIRRLDVILEFPPPGPDERRALWASHLGGAHALSQRQLNRLAAVADLGGGYIRNAVLAAAVLARSAARPIEYEDVLAGLTAEYKKLGKQLPAELRG
ncbi:ATP-binding protein [Sorangium sp. So ce388]|uniref:ATP-binding protein n=1 Tax=Sorangium sp. So ce388 TaxID=3133309 RepID=UPI003F5CAE25